MRNGPVPVVTNAEWQPYIDAAKKYALVSNGMSYDTAEADLQRLIEQTSGELHETVLNLGPALKDAVVAGKVKVNAEVLGAGLQSLDESAAEVVVVTKNTVLADNSAPNESTLRLKVQIVRIGDAFKASKADPL